MEGTEDMAEASGRVRRVALLCDVDQTIYHVGDEAIAAASAQELSRRGLEVVLVSRREKYGPPTRGARSGPEGTIRALTFPWPQVDRARYLDEIRRVLSGQRDALPPEDKLFEIIEQLRTVDALVIGGGGSLNSRFGWLLDERVAMAMVARSLGLTVVLTGQSLGPELVASDRAAVGELLDACSLVGLRDHDSLAIARTIRPDHPALHATRDDVISLDIWDEPLEDLVTVTLGSNPAPFSGAEYVAASARLLDLVSERTGAPVELVPHMADPDHGGGDLELHHEVARAMRTDARQAPLERAVDAARRQARARWVVSSRFHPVVFGSLSGAAVLALPMDRYGRSRMRGALRSLGLMGTVFPMAGFMGPSGEALTARTACAIDHLTGRRDPEETGRRGAIREARAAAEAWWDRIVDVLTTADGAEGGAAGTDTGPGPDAGEPRARGAWAPFAGERVPEPSVSVVVRTKDRPLLLDRAVQDVLGQTRTDWELVVVDDDGAPGLALDVLDRWAHELGDRCTLLRRETSTGMEAASNAGVDASRAPLLAIHDDDDTWHPLFLQQTTDHLRDHPDDLGVAVGAELVREHVADGGMIVEDEREKLWPGMASMRLLDFVHINRTVPICLTYRRELHEDLGLYRESLRVVGDYEFNLRVLQEGRVGWIARPLAHWHLRPGADGTASNSMFAMHDAHREVDLDLADEFFRDWARENGLGLPMFISRNVDHQLRSAMAAHERRMLDVLDGLVERIERTESQLAALQVTAEQILAVSEERSLVRLTRRVARSARTGAHAAIGRWRRRR